MVLLLSVFPSTHRNAEGLTGMFWGKQKIRN